MPWGGTWYRSICTLATTAAHSAYAEPFYVAKIKRVVFVSNSRQWIEDHLFEWLVSRSEKYKALQEPQFAIHLVSFRTTSPFPASTTRDFITEYQHEYMLVGFLKYQFTSVFSRVISKHRIINTRFYHCDLDFFFTWAGTCGGLTHRTLDVVPGIDVLKSASQHIE